MALTMSTSDPHAQQEWRTGDHCSTSLAASAPSVLGLAAGDQTAGAHPDTQPRTLLQQHRSAVATQQLRQPSHQLGKSDSDMECRSAQDPAVGAWASAVWEPPPHLAPLEGGAATAGEGARAWWGAWAASTGVEQADRPPNSRIHSPGPPDPLRGAEPVTLSGESFPSSTVCGPGTHFGAARKPSTLFGGKTDFFSSPRDTMYVEPVRPNDLTNRDLRRTAPRHGDSQQDGNADFRRSEAWQRSYAKLQERRCQPRPSRRDELRERPQIRVARRHRSVSRSTSPHREELSSAMSPLIAEAAAIPVSTQQEALKPVTQELQTEEQMSPSKGVAVANGAPEGSSLSGAPAPLLPSRSRSSSPSACAHNMPVAAPAVDLARLLLSLGVSPLPPSPRKEAGGCHRGSSPQLVTKSSCRGAGVHTTNASYPRSESPGVNRCNRVHSATMHQPPQQQPPQGGLPDETDNWQDDELPPWPHEM